jgi:putative transcriptional regulator
MPGKPFQSLRGSLLLDGGRLEGSWFHRTVVLICDHTPAGAFGLVLNRPDERTLEDAIEPEIPEPICREPLFRGGPVQERVLQFLYSDPAKTGGTGNVMDTLRVGHRLEELQGLADSWTAAQKLRIFAGHSGWTAGQLDNEIRREAWLIHPATPRLIFDVEPTVLWRFILRSRTNWEERLLADAPDDLRSN